jgi:hypothetical protein
LLLPCRDLQTIGQGEELTIVRQASRRLSQVDEPDLGVFLDAVKRLAAAEAAALGQARELDQDRVLQFDGFAECPSVGEHAADCTA